MLAHYSELHLNNCTVLYMKNTKMKHYWSKITLASLQIHVPWRLILESKKLTMRLKSEALEANLKGKKANSIKLWIVCRFRCPLSGMRQTSTRTWPLGKFGFPNIRARDHDYVKADELTTNSTDSCSFIGMNMLNTTGPQSCCFIWLKTVL
jgi:hypothetical protein